jgi:hypothetical protein
MSLLKIGSAEVNSMLTKAASVLREQKLEIDRLGSKLSEHDRSRHAEKIASTAVARGIMDVDEAKDYAETLFKSGKDLDMVEEFVARTAAGVPLGAHIQKTASVEGSEGDSDVLTAFLLSNDV